MRFRRPINRKFRDRQSRMFDAACVKPETEGGIEMKPQWTKRTAAIAVIEMSEVGRTDLTTGMCEALVISFESFLRFSQADDETRATIIRKLAGICELTVMTEDLGHCSQ